MRLATIAFSAVLTLASMPSLAEDESTATADAEGLVKAKVSGLQSVFVHPDADFSRYNRVMLDPIEVAFAKSWERQRDRRNITAAEKQEIQRKLERVLVEEFTRELSEKGRYQVVEAPAEDVLRIKAEIRDLYLNAPDVPRAGVSRSYTKSVGEMTLVAELRDAPTGALLARIIDRAEDPESVWLELTTEMDNLAAARRAATHWARILRSQLDAARVGRKQHH